MRGPESVTAFLSAYFGLSAPVYQVLLSSLETEENDDVTAGYKRRDVSDFVNAEVARWVDRGVLRLTPESGADGFTAFVLQVD